MSRRFQTMPSFENSWMNKMWKMQGKIERARNKKVTKQCNLIHLDEIR